MKLLAVIALLISLLLAGCSSQPIREGVDHDKAASANAELGLRYMQQGNYDVAMKKLEKALDFDSSHSSAHHYMAELYRRLERYDDADAHFRKALYAVRGDASSLHNNYGIFLCSRQRFDDGEGQLLKVLNNPVYSHKAQVYENLGLCMEGKPNLEKAESYLRQALKFDPRLAKSLLAMARLSFTKGEYLSSRGYLQRYLSHARHTAASLWLGIQVERILGDKNAVSSYGLLLRSSFPRAEETRLYLKSTE